MLRRSSSGRTTSLPPGLARARRNRETSSHNHPSRSIVPATAPLLQGCANSWYQNVVYGEYRHVASDEHRCCGREREGPGDAEGYDEDGTGSYSYQWQRSGDSITWSNISNANSDSYTVVKADAFNALRIEVRYVDGQGTSETVRSDETQIVNPSNFAPTGAPVIAGSLQEDATLSATFDGIADLDGLGTLSIQWQQ